MLEYFLRCPQLLSDRRYLQLLQLDQNITLTMFEPETSGFNESHFNIKIHNSRSTEENKQRF